MLRVAWVSSSIVWQVIWGALRTWHGATEHSCRPPERGKCSWAFERCCNQDDATMKREMSYELWLIYNLWTAWSFSGPTMNMKIRYPRYTTMIFFLLNIHVCCNIDVCRRTSTSASKVKITQGSVLIFYSLTRELQGHVLCTREAYPV